MKSLITSLLLSSFAFASPSFTVIQSIQQGSTLSGSLAWTVAISDTSTYKVEFLIDSGLRWTEYAVPYFFNGDYQKLDTMTLANGLHTFQVKATAKDNSSISSSVSANVNNSGGSSPTFTVSQSIQQGRTISGSVYWTVNISDSTSISKVDFFIDGVWKWRENWKPYFFNGDNKQLDTMTLTNGLHSFQVQVRPKSGSLVFQNVMASVNNSGGSPPPPPSAHSVSLNWTSSTTSGVTYNVYRKASDCSNASPFARLQTNIASTSYLDQAVDLGLQYCYQMTSVDSSGKESITSNQVSALIPQQ